MIHVLMIHCNHQKIHEALKLRVYWKLYNVLYYPRIKKNTLTVPGLPLNTSTPRIKTLLKNKFNPYCRVVNTTTYQNVQFWVNTSECLLRHAYTEMFTTKVNAPYCNAASTPQTYKQIEAAWRYQLKHVWKWSQQLTT